MKEGRRCLACGVEVFKEERERELCTVCKIVLGMVKWRIERLEGLARYVREEVEGPVMKMKREGLTFAEIGVVLGVRRQRAHQIWKAEAERRER